eukprot:14010502-Alexandrium_andersonii.AAC.1
MNGGMNVNQPMRAYSETRDVRKKARINKDVVQPVCLFCAMGDCRRDGRAGSPSVGDAPGVKQYAGVNEPPDKGERVQGRVQVTEDGEWKGR